MAGIPVTFVGEIYYSNLGIGGGPMPPGPGQPPTVWPPPGVVSPPIYYPPVFPAHPIYNPPVTVQPPIYYPPVFPAHPIVPPQPGYPAHPIVLPPVEPGGPPVEIWPKPGIRHTQSYCHRHQI